MRTGHHQSVKAHGAAVRLPLLLAAAFMVMSAAACVTIAPSGDSRGSPDVTAKPVAEVGASIDPTTGPKRTKKPRRPRDTAPRATTAPNDTPSHLPTMEPTAAPTDMPPGATVDPNATPFCCLTFRIPPIDIASGLVLEPVDPTTLDYTQSPTYGQATLGSGFAPDPYSVGMTAGGPVNVGYLGSGCTGFAREAPDLRVAYTGGAGLLRLYFIGSADSTVIVNDPFGNFYCVDDSFGTLNPTIDFNNPAGGAYDIWIGTYATATSISGTLYVTGDSGNHP